MAMSHFDRFDTLAHQHQVYDASESGWEDDDDTFCNSSTPKAAQVPTARPTSSSTASSVYKLRRFKSRQRQKAQNARAGIKLVTNLSLDSGSHALSLNSQATVFANSTTLNALEGLSTSALSPSDRPIMIGIRSDPRPTVRNPFNLLGPPDPKQQSMWSLDTPSTLFHCSVSSSVYSEGTLLPAVAFTTSGKDAPPVPAVPKVAYSVPRHKDKHSRRQNQKVAPIDQFASQGDDDRDDDDDGGSPFTLFEEDGDRRAAATAAFRETSATPVSLSAGTSSPTWWLQSGNSTPKTKASRESSGTEWWTKSPSLPMPAMQERQPTRSPMPHRTPSLAASQVASVYSAAHASIPIRLDPSVSSSNGALASLVRPAALAPSLPSPEPVSPQYTSSMASSFGAIDMSAIPAPLKPYRLRAAPALTPFSTASSAGVRKFQFVPTDPMGRFSDHVPSSFPSHGYGIPIPGEVQKVERIRRRHEKEDVVVHRIGRFWADWACLPDCSGCFGRKGREGRKRRRICLSIVALVFVAIMLTIVLAVLLTRGHSQVAARPTIATTGQPAATVTSTSTTAYASASATNVFLSVENFPPIPTGVLTMVGPNNPVKVDGCSDPVTVWSCSLPPDQHANVAPFKANQPTFMFQVQYDDSADQAWNVSAPVPTPTARLPSSANAPLASEALSPLSNGTKDVLERAINFGPNPSPPSFADVFFLGNTSDGIVSANKGGEPTPFYLSLLSSVKNTEGANERRLLMNRQGNNNPLAMLPPPDLNPDGSGAAALFLPRPQQQPLRLFDRGLPTEHYAFYSYFKRTIYVSSVSPHLASPPSVDENGGSLEDTATFLVTWGSVRYRVALWTRSSQTTSLLGAGASLVQNTMSESESRSPGTMPLPVSVSIDTHGGDVNSKFTWHHNVAADQHIDPSRPGLLPNNMAFEGSWINESPNNPDLSLGGVDGGTGGCRCQWTNFNYVA